MIYRAYGETGIEVSGLGFGGMRFEKPEAVGEMAEVVYHAFERGVTYFDTAPGYCDDKSEIIVGEAVKQMKKTGKPFSIATKTSSGDPATIRRHCERSLERLNVDAIDFYHVWCLVQPEDLPKRKALGALDEFRKLKEEGLVRHVCVSTHLEHGRVAEMLNQGDGLFAGMLIGLNAMNYRLRYPGVREAGRRSMGVVTMNTLAGGLMTDHTEHYDYIMRAGDSSIVESALRFNLSIPEVTVALIGFRNKADVDEAVAAVERFSPMSEDEVDELGARVPESSDGFCTQCGYCRDCPVDIPVVRLMEAYNYRILEGGDAALKHLYYHWGIPDVGSVLESCAMCGECESACTQHLPIMDRFEELRGDREIYGKCEGE